MPISVDCPACRAKLSAPDAAAGKRIKCKTCQFVVVVPAPAADPGFEVVERPAPPPPRAAVPARAAAPRKPAPSVEDDTPPPRAKSRNRNRDADDERPKKKSQLLLILLLVGGGTFALIAVVGAVIVGSFLSAAKTTSDDIKAQMEQSSRTKPQDAAPPPSVPTVNWVAYENTNTKYKASFPGVPPSKLDPLADISDPEQRRVTEGLMKTFNADAYGLNTSGRRYLINGMVYPARDAGSFNPKAYVDRIDAVARELYGGAGIGKPKWVLVNGHLGKDFVVTHNNRTVLVRYLATRDTVFTVRVEGDPFMKENDETAKEFLEKFQPTGPNGPYTEADFATGKAPKKK